MFYLTKYAIFITYRRPQSQNVTFFFKKKFFPEKGNKVSLLFWNFPFECLTNIIFHVLDQYVLLSPVGFSHKE
jgi:hypothetical protein